MQAVEALPHQLSDGIVSIKVLLADGYRTLQVRACLGVTALEPQKPTEVEQRCSALRALGTERADVQAQRALFVGSCLVVEPVLE